MPLRRAFAAGPTIAEAFGRGRAAGNNFDAIRLFAALMVAYAHAFLLTTVDNPTDFIDRFSGGQTGMGDLPIAVFFVLSGFLIAQSWLRRPSLSAYFRNRAMRIYPAFIVVVLVCVFIVGPLVSTLPSEDYFAHKQTWRYFQNLTFFTGSDRLPGVFEDSVFVQSVIGPMWTLDYEVASYIALAALGFCGLLTPRGCLIMIVLCIGLSAIIGDAYSNHLEVFLYRFGVMGAWFFGGAFLAVAGAHIRLNRALALTAFALLLVTASTAGYQQAFVFCGAYLTIFVGLAALGPLRHAGRFGDFSYSIYLWSWPIQQVTAIYFANGSVLIVLAVSLPLSLLVAACSWHLIEKPALRLKSRKALARSRLSKGAPEPAGGAA